MSQSRWGVSDSLRVARRARSHSRTRDRARPALEVLEGKCLLTTFTPAQIRQAYGVNQIAFGGTAGTGAGETIAIIDVYHDPNIASDLDAFDQQFTTSTSSGTTLYQGYGPASSFLTVQNFANGATDPTGHWEGEEALDVEWAHAVAPAARIILVEAPANASITPYIAYGAGEANVVSMSFGGAEFSGETNNSTEGAFTHPGVVYVGASGDTGPPATWPTVSPDVIGVGGTSLTLDPNNNWAGESVWNDTSGTNYSSSGGGPSVYFQGPPPYQANVVTQTSNRAAPDVSYDGDPNTGFYIYDSVPYQVQGGSLSGFFGIGGTSAGTPQWAALFAVADQGRALNHLPQIDATDPQEALQLLYKPAVRGDYHDIVSGSSSGPGGSYPAQGGYDLATGLGSPQANLLVPALASATWTPRPANKIYDDFTGAGHTDISLYLPGSSAGWYVDPNGGPTQPGPSYQGPGTYSVTLGGSGDIPVPGDYDGNGVTSPAVFTPSTGTWTIWSSVYGVYQVQFGGGGYIPVPGDYNGDGKTDLALFQPSTGDWVIDPTQGPGQPNSGQGTGPYLVQFGGSAFIPAPGDYNGDGKTDLAVFLPSTGQWVIDPTQGPGQPNSGQGNGVYVVSFGGNGFNPVPGDYNGDGKTDIALFQPSTGDWVIDPTQGPGQPNGGQGTGPYLVQFGGSAFTPAPGDYNGDGKTDLGVFLPSSGEWVIDPTQGPGQPNSGQGNGAYVVYFGGNGFIPVTQPSYYLYGAAAGQGGAGGAAVATGGGQGTTGGSIGSDALAGAPASGPVAPAPTPNLPTTDATGAGLVAPVESKPVATPAPAPNPAPVIRLDAVQALALTRVLQDLDREKLGDPWETW